MNGARRLLPDRPRRVMAEPVVPMINVVFLLLIFFLMTARIAPAPPFPVVPPEGSAEDLVAEAVLFIGADGQLAFAGHEGAAALDAAADTPALRIAADRALDGATLSRILADLAGRGVDDIALTVAGR